MKQTRLNPQYSRSASSIQALHAIPIPRDTTKTNEQNTRKTTKVTKVTKVIIPKKHNSKALIYPLIASLNQPATNQTIKNQAIKNQVIKNQAIKNQARTKQAIKNTDHQWLTWISHRKPSAQEAKHYGISGEHLRIVHIDANTDCRWIIWEALNAGNSHTVIAEIPSISNCDIKEMELAANQGRCNGIIVCASSLETFKQ